VSQRPDPGPELDAVIVGAGFAGLAMLHQLRERGFSARVLERGSGLGGTWYWNRYPGARCDVESMEYSYQFSDALQQEWSWSERYAAQPEILRYLEHVADRFDLRRDIALDTRVDAAVYDEDAGCWTLETQRGDRIRARFCIMATGCLSSAHTPRFPGLESFEGALYHTGAWPHTPVDFRGLRVGVIGTGSSAVQSIPLIAEQAAALFVFQRTATYTVPAHNHPLDPAEAARIKADYAGLRRRAAQQPFGLDTRAGEALALEATPAQRRAEYESRWERGGLPFLSGYADLLSVQAANDTAAEFVRGKIREIVRDPAVAERLSPRQVLGCKRLCIDSGYYQTFNRENVTLVDVSAAPIEALLPRGLRTRDAEYTLDAIVFATGFDAMTGALARIEIQGRQGLSLAKKWAEGPRTYLGLASAGFPNLFLITGPGSPSVLSNMVPSIEQHAGWIARCIGDLRARGQARIEARTEAEDAWVAHVNEVASATLFPSCNSWYLGANVPGKPRVFMPYLGFPAYVEKCEEVAARGYEGFATSR
jgi:cyclohexanone monooxygenase